MIVFEKARALCQQLPGYKEIVPSFTPRARARDFYDIHLMVDQFLIDPATAENLELIRHIFEAKKVPLDFLRQLRAGKALHEGDWENVLSTISAGDRPHPFDFYFEYVMARFEHLTFP